MLKESILQTQCVAWFRWQYPQFRKLLIAIPNGARLHGDAKQRAMQWARLEKEGAVKGAADLFFAVPSGDYAGLFIEMKTPAGRQSPDQKEFEKAVLDAGFGYAMPRTFEQFQYTIKTYLAHGQY